MKKSFFSLMIIFLLSTTFTVSQAALLTFDDSITGETSHSFDGDGDGVDDVVFSTTDPSGFNTLGFGPNMTYIHEPGLEGTSLLNPDLRVDFLFGAKDYLNFGFTLASFSENANTWASFEVYDASDVLIASAFEFGLYTTPNGVNPSDFPEGYITTSFLGIASYALFDFSADYDRYIIDDFEGNFGSTEAPPVPEPATLLLLGSGLIGMFGLKKRKKSSNS